MGATMGKQQRKRAADAEAAAVAATSTIADEEEDRLDRCATIIRTTMIPTTTTSTPTQQRQPVADSLNNASDSSLEQQQQQVTASFVNQQPNEKKAPVKSAAEAELSQLPVVVTSTTAAAAAAATNKQTGQSMPPTSGATNGVPLKPPDSQDPFFLDPSGSFHSCWSMVVSLAFLYNFWSLSYRFAFREIDYDTMALWFALDYSADLIYALEIVINWNTGYLKDGVLQGDNTGPHYRERTLFYLDCLCLMPLDILYLSFGFNSIFRCFRLLKIYKFWSFMDHRERHTNYPNVIRTFTLVHYILVIFHWNACLFHMISKSKIIDIENLYRIADNRCGDILCQYLHAFYWSTLALTCIGDLPRPRTKGEYLYVTGELFFGLFLFASVLGHVANIVTNVSAARKEFQAKLDAVKTYMRMRRVSDELQSKVIQWFDYLWTSQKSSDEERSVACLPYRLKAEIAIQVHLDTLKRVKIFTNTEAGFLRELVLRLKPVLFSPGDYVCRKNEVGHEMYIVSRGILEVVTDEGSSLKVPPFKAGDYFGEFCVLNLGHAGNRRTASVRSVGYSDLFCLNKQDFWDVLKDYPSAEARIRACAEERLSKLPSGGGANNQVGAGHRRRVFSSGSRYKSQPRRHLIEPATGTGGGGQAAAVAACRHSGTSRYGAGGGAGMHPPTDYDYYFDDYDYDDDFEEAVPLVSGGGGGGCCDAYHRYEAAASAPSNEPLAICHKGTRARPRAGTAATATTANAGASNNISCRRPGSFISSRDLGDKQYQRQQLPLPAPSRSRQSSIRQQRQQQQQQQQPQHQSASATFVSYSASFDHGIPSSAARGGGGAGGEAQQGSAASPSRPTSRHRQEGMTQLQQQEQLVSRNSSAGDSSIEAAAAARAPGLAVDAAARRQQRATEEPREPPTEPDSGRSGAAMVAHLSTDPSADYTDYMVGYLIDDADADDSHSHSRRHQHHHLDARDNKQLGSRQLAPEGGNLKGQQRTGHSSSATNIPGCNSSGSLGSSCPGDNRAAANRHHQIPASHRHGGSTKSRRRPPPCPAGYCTGCSSTTRLDDNETTSHHQPQLWMGSSTMTGPMSRSRRGRGGRHQHHHSNQTAAHSSSARCHTCRDEAATVTVAHMDPERASTTRQQPPPPPISREFYSPQPPAPLTGYYLLGPSLSTGGVQSTTTGQATILQVPLLAASAAAAGQHVPVSGPHHHQMLQQPMLAPPHQTGASQSVSMTQLNAQLSPVPPLPSASAAAADQLQVQGLLSPRQNHQVAPQFLFIASSELQLNRAASSSLAQTPASVGQHCQWPQTPSQHSVGTTPASLECEPAAPLQALTTTTPTATTTTATNRQSGGPPESSAGSPSPTSTELETTVSQLAGSQERGDDDDGGQNGGQLATLASGSVVADADAAKSSSPKAHDRQQ